MANCPRANSAYFKLTFYHFVSKFFSSYLQFLKEMLEMLSSDNNYSNYRNEIAKSEGFNLPVM